MKITMLSLLVLLSAMAYGQIPIDSFYVPGTTWIEAYPSIEQPCSNATIFTVTKVVYEISGNVTIGGVNYHQLSYATAGGYSFSSSTGVCTPVDDSSCGPATPVFTYLGRLRVDSNRVYFTQDSGYSPYFGSYLTIGQEYLLYDFNLTAGGSMPSTLVTERSFYGIESIDSVALSNGMRVARFNDSSGSWWIWGVGSSLGFLPNLFYFVAEWGPGPHPNGDEITLCYDNPGFTYNFTYPTEILDYGFQYNCFDFSTSGCGNNNTGTTSPLNTYENLNVFPNPTSSTLYITSPDTILNVVICNTVGQIFYSGQFDSRSIQIDVAFFPKGFYFANVDGEVAKFVKD